MDKVALSIEKGKEKEKEKKFEEHCKEFKKEMDELCPLENKVAAKS